jgi:hypothetical protein
VLQELLAKFPDLLAGDQLAGADARRWVLIDREMSSRACSQGEEGRSAETEKRAKELEGQFANE